MVALGGGQQPFDEANQFLRNKINLPTERWDDLQKGMHARAFTVAGATTDGVLSDFRAAIEKAQTQGTSFEAFQKDFDNIVAKNGWSYKGARGWRARTIFETNLRTAHAAGRYQQMTRPEVLADRPYWMYRKSNSASPRAEHAVWDGIVLLASDPWWQTHYPPNGWGCKCKVITLNERLLKRMGKTGADPTPTNGKVDPAWAYNVGEAGLQNTAAAGQSPGRPGRSAEQQKIDDAWENLDTTGPADFNRPASIPVDQPKETKLGERARSPAELLQMTRDAIGGESAVVPLKSGDFTHTVTIDAQDLSDHISKDFARSRYLPFLVDTLRNPFEVWGSFARNTETGEFSLRYRYVRSFAVQDEAGVRQNLLVVATADKGKMVALTVFPAKSANYLEKQRKGRLLFGR